MNDFFPVLMFSLYDFKQQEVESGVWCWCCGFWFFFFPDVIIC